MVFGRAAAALTWRRRRVTAAETGIRCDLFAASLCLSLAILAALLYALDMWLEVPSGPEKALFLVGGIAVTGGHVAWLARALKQVEERLRSADEQYVRRGHLKQMVRETVHAEFWEAIVGTSRVAITGALQRLYELPPETQLSDILEPEALKVLEQAHFRQWVPGDRFDSQFPMTLPNGEVRRTRVVGVAFSEYGTLRMIGLTIDVTANQVVREQLVAAASEIERAREERDRFVKSAAYALREPVQTMSLYMHIIRRQKVGGLAPVVDGLDEALAELSGMLDALIEIKRLDSGDVQIRRERVRAGEVWDRIASEYRPRLRPGVEMRVVPTALGVECDPVALGKILRAIVDNAVKFTERGRIVLGCRRQGEHALFVVGDTGIGIPPDRIPHIYGDFVQIDERAAKGLGLGLAMAARLARIEGMSIQVSSAPGRGSIFTVSVPLSRQPAGSRAGADADAAAPAPVSKMLVALIAPDRDVRDEIKAALRSDGHAVVDGTTAAEIVDVLSGAIPDVVIADLLLEGAGSGIAAVKAVRKACRWPVPGVLLSDEAGSGRLETMDGMPLLPKYVAVDRLKAVLEAAVTGAPWLH